MGASRGRLLFAIGIPRTVLAEEAAEWRSPETGSPVGEPWLPTLCGEPLALDAW